MRSTNDANTLGGRGYSIFKELATLELDPDATEGSMVYLSVCGPGGGSCVPGPFLSPLVSEDRTFHPESLREATIQINAILDELRMHSPAGRDLDFLQTPVGMMLAWSQHDVAVPPNAVTAGSSYENIMRAFGLVDTGESY